MWRDSLVVGRKGSGGSEFEIFLESFPGPTGILETAVAMEVFYSTRTNSEEDSEAHRIEIPLDTMQGLLKGKRRHLGLPKHTVSAHAILKVRSTRDTNRLPNSCLEGMFELRSEKAEISL